MNGCLICGCTAEKDELFCKECVKFAIELKRRCRKCGAFTLDPSRSDCHSCQNKKIFFDSIYSCYIYSGSVTNIISKMKYAKIQSFAEVMGRHIALMTPVEILRERTVIFPPMTFLSRFIRSFNQAEILAERVARHHRLKFDRQLIKKNRKTKPQASLTYDERQKNLKNAFSLNRSVKNEKFLIVDDVCTTFSTINTIAELLKKNGAESVNAVTIARTSPYFT
jgi:ComF family protein